MAGPVGAAGNFLTRPGPRLGYIGPAFTSTAYTMFSLIGTIIVGFIVGLLARALKPGDDKLGIIMTSLLGIGGSLLASWAGQKMGWYLPGAPAGWIASIVGAVVLLLIYGLVKGK